MTNGWFWKTLSLMRIFCRRGPSKPNSDHSKQAERAGVRDGRPKGRDAACRGSIHYSPSAKGGTSQHSLRHGNLEATE